MLFCMCVFCVVCGISCARLKSMILCVVLNVRYVPINSIWCAKVFALVLSWVADFEAIKCKLSNPSNYSHNISFASFCEWTSVCGCVFVSKIRLHKWSMYMQNNWYDVIVLSERIICFIIYIYWWCNLNREYIEEH